MLDHPVSIDDNQRYLEMAIRLDPKDNMYMYIIHRKENIIHLSQRSSKSFKWFSKQQFILDDSLVRYGMLLCHKQIDLDPTVKDYSYIEYLQKSVMNAPDSIHKNGLLRLNKVHESARDYFTTSLRQVNNLTPEWQLSPQGTFFPFGLKWKPLSRRHVMISVKTFSPKITTMKSSFMETVYIFDIFYHLRAVNESKSEVWKGKNLCHWGVKR